MLFKHHFPFNSEVVYLAASKASFAAYNYVFNTLGGILAARPDYLAALPDYLAARPDYLAAACGSLAASCGVLNTAKSPNYTLKI